MEQRGQKTSMILKYSKRRYDGGSEIEVIQSIERKQAVAQLERLRQKRLDLEVASAAQVAENEPQPAERPQPQPATVAVDETPSGNAEASATRKSRILEALILGPMELCVGIVGLMTAGLAIFTFHRLNNQALLKQSKEVWTDCLQTFQKGLLHTLTTPVRVLKASRA